MKNNLKLLAVLFIGITLFSCSDDDPILPNPPGANIKSLGGGEEIAQNDTLYLIAEINSSEEATHS